jgi:hypothetical protein
VWGRLFAEQRAGNQYSVRLNLVRFALLRAGLQQSGMFSPRIFFPPVNWRAIVSRRWRDSEQGQLFGFTVAERATTKSRLHIDDDIGVIRPNFKASPEAAAVG